MRAEELVDILRGLTGVESVVPGGSYPQCEEVAGLYKGKPFFIYIYGGRHLRATILKITPSPAGCMEALASPEGLYSIVYGRWRGILADSLRVKIAAVTGNQQV